MKHTPTELHLRKELGKLTHRIQEMIDERRKMHADLVAQRADMTTAINLLDRGCTRDAIQVLKDSIAYRERNREPRKNPAPRDPDGPV